MQRFERLQFGNLPRGTISKYASRPDVFFGTVKTKNGPLYGLWQKPARFVELQWSKRRSPRLADKGVNTSGRLKLLVAFHAPVQTKKRLEFGSRAQAVVSANVDRVFGAELAKAIGRAH